MIDGISKVASAVASRFAAWGPIHDEDAMAVEKLGEGMRPFDTEARELEQFARAKMTQRMAS